MARATLSQAPALADGNQKVVIGQPSVISGQLSVCTQLEVQKLVWHKVVRGTKSRVFKAGKTSPPATAPRVWTVSRESRSLLVVFFMIVGLSKSKASKVFRRA